MTKQANLQQMKEIKDTIQELNEQMVAIDAKIMSNHQEVMNKIEIVDKKNKGSSTNCNKKTNRNYQNKRR